MSKSYSFTITSPQPAEEVFEYLADLRNVPEWDPETERMELISDGDPVQVGATFRLDVARKLPPKVTMEYELIELERPHRIVARGTSPHGGGVDTYTISETADGGSEIVYTTEIELSGIGKVATPFADFAIGRSGEKTRKGLERTLNPD